MKELPWMFAIAGILWLIVVVIVYKNFKKSSGSFFAKHRTSIIAIIAAVVLTVTDIWLFVQYIPTHFRKEMQAEPATISEKEIAAELQLADSSAKPGSSGLKNDSVQTNIKKDSVEKVYTDNKTAIRFLSSTASEDIEAKNNNATSIFNASNGKITFIALIKNFHFENGLMQDHFNQPEYMNSAAFPKATFKGNIANFNASQLSVNGNYPVTATGNLTIHGVTKHVEAAGTLTVSGKNIHLKSNFKVHVQDYGVDGSEVADQLDITVTAAYQQP